MLSAYKRGTTETVFAERGLDCVCPDCGEALVARCGEIKVNHFAHKVSTDCDSRFYDGMSEWHRDWQLTIKNPTPGINVEVYIKKEEYSKRADLVSRGGLIIEFQKSHLPLSERITREHHYKNMVWVVHEDLANSATWREKPSTTRILIEHTSQSELYDPVRKFYIPKSRFIRSIINGGPVDYEVWRKLHERCNRNIVSQTGEPIGWKSQNGLFDLFNKCFENIASEERVGKLIKAQELEHLHNQTKERLLWSDPQRLQLALADNESWCEAERYECWLSDKVLSERSLVSRLSKERDELNRKQEYYDYLNRTQLAKERLDAWLELLSKPLLAKGYVRLERSPW